MAASKEIIQACDKIQGQFTSGTCSFNQYAAIAALDGDMTPTYQMRDAFKKRRDIVMQHIQDIPKWKCNVPDGAFYVFPNVSNYFGLSDGKVQIKNGNDLAMYLLENAHVASVGGDSFGDDQCMRFSYATSEQNLNIAFNRIKEALSKLK